MNLTSLELYPMAGFRMSGAQSRLFGYLAWNLTTDCKGRTQTDGVLKQVAEKCIGTQTGRNDRNLEKIIQ